MSNKKKNKPPEEHTQERTAPPRIVNKIFSLTQDDLQRLESIRRQLLHKELVAPYSHIVSAGLSALEDLNDGKLLELLTNIRTKDEPQVHKKYKAL